MKKITILLLTLLMIASCFAFASCEEEPQCPEGGSHVYRNIYDEPSSYCNKCGQQKSSKPSISVGETIVFGIVCLVVGLIMHWIGLYNESVFFLRVPFFAFLIITFGVFATFGISRGIIMSVFFVLFVVGTIKLNRKHLDHDDYV